MRPLALTSLGALAVCVALAPGDTPSPRGLLSDAPTTRTYGETAARLAPRVLDDSPVSHDARLLRPDPGEKTNRPSEEVEKRFLNPTAPARTVLPDPNADKADRLDRQAGR